LTAGTRKRGIDALVGDDPYLNRGAPKHPRELSVELRDPSSSGRARPYQDNSSEMAQRHPESKHYELAEGPLKARRLAEGVAGLVEGR
jgi:hypothetical protein